MKVSHSTDSFPIDDQWQKDLEEQLLKQLANLEEGSTVMGKVVYIKDHEVFIDIGYKAEGCLSLDEFETPPKINDQVSVVLVRKDVRNGSITLSKRKADEKHCWTTLKEAYEKHLSIKGTIHRMIKGGYEVKLCESLYAFNPVSKIDIHKPKSPESYVGMESEFCVERIYNEHRVNIVLSRKAWLQKSINVARDTFFHDYEIGDIVEGEVKTLTSFGAFIDLGGFDALLHINDMSWSKVFRPSDCVKKHTRIKLKIIKMDGETKKINLSLRQMKEDPWTAFEDKYYVGQIVKGTITQLTDFGAFLEVEEGIQGLIHVSEMSWVERIEHPKDILSVGQEVEAKILDYDIQAGRVSFGIKQTTKNPWDEIDIKYPVGTRVMGTVKNFTNSGVFIMLEPGIDAFLHVEDISWTEKYKSASFALKQEEECEVIVIMCDSEHHKIRVGMKQLSEDPWKTTVETYSLKQIITGKITNITDFGIFVQLPTGIQGLIPKSQLTAENTYEETVKEYAVGDEVQSMIIDIPPNKRRISLSIKAISQEEDSAAIQKYIQEESNPDNSIALSEILKNKPDS